jgi:membrane protease YdiL (CAAX protease family)
MQPSPPPAPQPAAAPFSVWHAVGVWFAGFIGSIVFALVGFAVTGDPADDPGALVDILAIVGTFSGYAMALAYVSRRRGTGSWRQDYGFVVHREDWWFVLAGVALFAALITAILPLIVLVDEQQEAVDRLQDAGGAELAVLAIAALVAAPVFEELLYRGLLLRALLRRFDPPVAIAICGVTFGAVHLLDFSTGTLARLPALIGMGIVSAIVAVRSGNLSRSILLHVGFNLPTVTTILLT